MTTRHGRFWLVGLVLIAGNIGYAGLKMISLKQSLTTAEVLLHIVVVLVGVALLDRELAKEWGDRLLKALPFTRKNGNDPPPPAEG